MTPRIETLRSFIRAEKHHQFRRTPEELGLANLNEKFQSANTPAVERSARASASLALPWDAWQTVWAVRNSPLMARSTTSR